MFNKKIDFYVVDNDFPLIEDGILGLPALQQFKFELSNDKLKLDDNIILLQQDKTIASGQTISKTVYLEGKPIPVCFINGGESKLKITNAVENSNTYDQISTFKGSVRLSHIEKALREPLEKILLYYLDVFNFETQLLPCTSLAKHTITLKENKIMNTKSYRPPECHKA